jgi:DNA-binding NarL/FixJ family response regulator
MQATSMVFAAQSSGVPIPPPSSSRLVSPPGLPRDLSIRALDPSERLIAVSFSLGRLTALSRAELDVARWADAGLSNTQIALKRNTSKNTVARQVSNVLWKLGVGSRLGLATVPELSAWTSPNGSGLGGDVAVDFLVSAPEPAIEAFQAARIWSEIASGQWNALAGIDSGGLRYATMSRSHAKPVDWLALNGLHREVLALMAGGLAQKVIAMKLGLAHSTVSSALGSARRRLGFATLGQLLRAYCANR